VKSIARARTHEEIAQVHMIIQFTVRTHIGHILAELSASDRTEAVAITTQQGILTFGPS